MSAPHATGWICPLCGSPLAPAAAGLACPRGHCFDRSREGYVNLLPVQKKRAKDPGDSKQMVLARHSFLSAGWYDAFRQELARLTLAWAPPSAHVLDAGCGEGSYDQTVWQAFAEQGRPLQLLGFDLSRPAVRLAARQVPQASFCVAGSFAAPVATGWADVLLNVFSPMARQEFLRVLAPGGILIYAVPTPRHLFGLKQLLYDTPYENPAREVCYEGFTRVDRQEVTQEIVVPAAQLQNLFAMTPYFWRTPSSGIEKLQNVDALRTEIGFSFLVYRRDG